MEKYEVLDKCESKELSPKMAYRELYGHINYVKIPKAHFIKLSIRIKEHPGLSVFLAFLFALPIPIGVARMFLKRKQNDIINESFPITYKQVFDELIVKGIHIDIDAKNEAKIKIKTL